jgi:hypothetical protein
MQAWGRAVVERAGGICEHCGYYRTLSPHHFILRRFRKTATDIRNGFALCVECHVPWAHKHPTDFKRFAEITLINRGDFNTLEEVWQWERTAKYPKDKR